MKLNYECEDPRPKTAYHSVLLEFLASGKDHCEVVTEHPRRDYSGLHQLIARNGEYSELSVRMRNGKIYLVREGW